MTTPGDAPAGRLVSGGGHPPARADTSRGSLLLLRLAALVVSTGIGILWFRDGRQQPHWAPEGVLGVQHVIGGLALLDVAVVAGPERRLALLATLTVRDGPADRVAAVRIEGTPARLSGPADAWQVSGADLLEVRPDGGGPRATAAPANPRAAGSFVPVTVVFATRGATTFQVPVLPPGALATTF